MKFITPNVEWWPQKTIAQQIARVGRICYKSAAKQPSEDLSDADLEQFIESRDKERTEAFWKSGHRSMYRHGTAYYFIKHDGKLPKWIWSVLSASPYVDSIVQEHHVWISTNMQYLCEHFRLMEILDPYGIDEQEFIEKAMQYKCTDAIWLIRMTMVVTTQISTTRELNRTSPNNIAEQSTRYVNMKKKGGVGIATPHWFNAPSLCLGDKVKRFLARLVFSASCKFAEWSYLLLLKLSLKPQDARGVLPIDSYSIVAYTYNLYEWKHIIDLRLRGTTGKPHPNAVVVAEQIADIINTRLRIYIPDFEI